MRRNAPRAARRIARGGVLACVVGAASCGGPGRHEAHLPAPRVPAGAVVATVDGEPLTARDVEAVARAEGITDPRAALRRAVDEALLSNEARRRGLARDPQLGDTRRRAVIQSLLRDAVESAERPDNLPQNELAAGLQIREFDLRHGELVRTEHALLRLPPGASPAAASAARQALEALRARFLVAPPPREGDALADAYNAVLGAFPQCGAGPVERTCRRLESVPAIDASGRHARGGVVPQYAAAAHALASAGDVSPVVATDFGLHVIVLRERLPPLERSDADVRALVAAELLVRRRGRALEQLLEDLRRRYGGAVSEAAIRAVERARLGEAQP